MGVDSSVVQQLSQTDLFSSLSRRALERVASQANVVHHAAGKEITEQGRSAAGFHLITDGTASVSVNGAERPDIGPGQYFGEISLIDGEPRSATVVARTDLTTISLVSWAFTPILDEEPEVTKRLLTVLCSRLRAAEQS